MDPTQRRHQTRDTKSNIKSSKIVQSYQCSKIVKIIVKSSFLITLIKCLKSLGWLFNVKKYNALYSVTRGVGPGVGIELSQTLV